MKRLLVLVASILVAIAAIAQQPQTGQLTAGRTSAGILWQDPGNIASRDLYYGPGGRQHEAHGTLTFIKEDLKGTNPKVVVRDDDGIVWGVKLGPEARPETVSSRIVWAVGYFADENYFVSVLHVRGLPPHLHRGRKFVAPDASLRDVRLKRYSQGDERLAGDWQWRSNPFSGTRELNGLRVMMAVINNWDVTDENNAIHEKMRNGEVVERHYLVGDVGSTFGSANLTWPMSRARGNLAVYSHSRFIVNAKPDYVDFHAPAGASLFFLPTRDYYEKRQVRWIGRQIPRADAKWIGQLLGQLSPDQIHSAFRAAGYSPADVDAFTEALQKRIRSLNQL